MKLRVERSGGFAGAIRQGEEDEAALTAEQRAALQTLLRGGAKPALESAHADSFVYRVEVRDESGVRTVTVPESQMPRSLAAIATRPK